MERKSVVLRVIKAMGKVYTLEIFPEDGGHTEILDQDRGTVLFFTPKNFVFVGNANIHMFFGKLVLIDGLWNFSPSSDEGDRMTPPAPNEDIYILQSSVASAYLTNKGI